MTSSLPCLVPLAKTLDENKVTPGVLGFIVFAVLGGAVWLLMKSMNKQFGKIDFEEQPDRGEPDRAGADGAEEANEADGPGETDGAGAVVGAAGGAGRASGAEADAQGGRETGAG